MRIEQSPEYKAEMEKRHKEYEREERRLKCQLAKALALISGDIPWQPIEKCPFAALAEEYGFDGTILVTDGKGIALATIQGRFGRPQYWTGDEPPEQVWRDGYMSFEGNGEWKEPDNPEWWFKWEFTDKDGDMTYAGGEETGKEEIPFVATHWFPLRVIKLH